jgi:Na+-translocating ferredoxin:NAD+ oxidoreductase RnfG subunit
MDRKGLFLIVFLFTLASTLAVALVSILTEQGPLYTVLYSLVAMWIVGIISQVLITSVYQSVIKPLEEEKREAGRKEVRKELNLSEVEEIDEAVSRYSSAEKNKHIESEETSSASLEESETALAGKE